MVCTLYRDIKACINRKMTQIFPEKVKKSYWFCGFYLATNAFNMRIKYVLESKMNHNPLNRL